MSEDAHAIVRAGLSGLAELVPVLEEVRSRERVSRALEQIGRRRPAPERASRGE